VSIGSEFKEFAMKGNVIDMAVGVIVGAAFGKIVSSFVGDVIMPPLGKLIGGGLPIGALGGRAAQLDVFDPRRGDAVAHGGTFSANPVSLHAGLAALHALDAAAIARIDGLGERLRTGLDERGYAVTGRGSLLKVHAPDPVELWWRLYRAGVLIALGGLMCVSTAMDDAVIDQVLVAFERA